MTDITNRRIIIDNIPAIIWGKASNSIFIYVHGKMSRKEYAEQFAAIAEIKGYQTISFDLPEHGERTDHSRRCDIWNGMKDLNSIAEYAYSNWGRVSLFACSLGAYFALNTYKNRVFEQILFQSPIVDMEWLVEHMMLWAGVTKTQLEIEKEIDTPIDLLRWDYYQYIKGHPITDWHKKTKILYGGLDNLQDKRCIENFAERFQCELFIAENSEHSFMAGQDFEIVNKWINDSISTNKEKERVAIVTCSNGQEINYKHQNDELELFLKSLGKEVVVSKCIYAKQDVFPGTVEERANALMEMYKDKEITEIYDISGGDIANQILDYLDFEVIAESHARFWGYSDLTTILNAIYTMTGKEGILYQVKNMVWGNFSKLQQERFTNPDELFYPKFKFVQGDSMEGIVVGGNLRCFLKLAGTKYFPDLSGKILLLEALGGRPAQMSTYLAQLKQMGAFDKISGILLGTFTEMEREALSPDIIEIVKEYAGNKLPIAKTAEIGHGNDSKAIVIGKNIRI